MKVQNEFVTRKPARWEALHYVPAQAESLIDVGCNVGDALLHAHALGIRKLYGVEINPLAAEEAKSRLARVPHSQIYQGSADRIPVESATLDAATCCEVLEHIPSSLRPRVVEEVYRVLKPGAPFILTVPFDGAFAALDPANVRFRFPSVYRWASRLAGGLGREAGYENQEHGVVWHHHFRMDELRSLLEPRFEIHHVRWRGSLLTPLGEWLLFPCYRRKAYRHPVFRAVKSLQDLDMAVPLGPWLAYDVLIVARHRSA
jgi:SAM-dependent methyltransferase